MALLVAFTIKLSEKTWLSNSILVWLGKRSYSLYMIHAVVHLYTDLLLRIILKKQVTDLSLSYQYLGLIISVSVTIFMANIVYQIFEVKIHQFLKQKLG